MNEQTKRVLHKRADWLWALAKQRSIPISYEDASLLKAICSELHLVATGGELNLGALEHKVSATFITFSGFTCSCGEKFEANLSQNFGMRSWNEAAVALVDDVSRIALCPFDHANKYPTRLACELHEDCQVDRNLGLACSKKALER